MKIQITHIPSSLQHLLPPYILVRVRRTFHKICAPSQSNPRTLQEIQRKEIFLYNLINVTEIMHKAIKFKSSILIYAIHLFNCCLTTLSVAQNTWNEMVALLENSELGSNWEEEVVA